MDDGIYEHDPDLAPDANFEPGSLAHLLPGNSGRMLDPRRTPVTVLSVDPALATFDLRVEAFEDRGARWRLPVEDVSGFQFGLGAERASARLVAELEAAISAFSGRLELAAEPRPHRQTELALAAERARIAPLLAARPALRELDLAAHVESRTGSADAAAALTELARERGLASLEADFARTYVSNPRSGEVVKGHAIVLAEMGLCSFAGRAVRDPALFEGDATRAARRAHILLRLAFLAELMALLGNSSVELHRGVASAAPLEAERGASFVSASFSREVAVAHFRSRVAFTNLSSRRVAVDRLFMTFLETPEMNAPYREAEALLLARDGAPLF